MSTIKVDVVSAEEQIFSGDAEFVALPGEAGELGILPQHAPLISLIKPVLCASQCLALKRSNKCLSLVV